MTDLPPGPELDALIATKVMGWGIIHYAGHQIIQRPGITMNEWSPSQSIADAWEVVEKLKHADNFEIAFYEGEWVVGSYVNDEPIWEASAATLPHAICLAALKAISKSSGNPG